MSTPTQSTHSALGVWFANLWHAITGRSISLWNALEPVIASDAGKAIESLLPIASGIVLQLATSQLTGSEKKNAAFDQIKAAATGQAISAATDIVDTTIQLALLNLRATGQVAPADPTPAQVALEPASPKL